MLFLCQMHINILTLHILWCCLLFNRRQKLIIAFYYLICMCVYKFQSAYTSNAKTSEQLIQDEIKSFEHLFLQLKVFAFVFVWITEFSILFFSIVWLTTVDIQCRLKNIVSVSKFHTLNQFVFFFQKVNFEFFVRFFSQFHQSNELSQSPEISNHHEITR